MPLGEEPGPRWMRAVAWLVARVPYAWLRALGGCLGWFAGSVLRIRRRHVEASLRAAGIPSARAVARASYASLGAGLFELLWLAGRPPGALGDRFQMDAGCAAALRRAAARRRGVVVATAHTGNWDFSACAAALWLAREAATGARTAGEGAMGAGTVGEGAADAGAGEGMSGARTAVEGGMGAGAALHVVTKRLSWRALDRYWQRLRAERGVVLLDAAGAAATVRSALGAGGVVALLVDQAPERESGVVTFPFLGAPARHDVGPALLAARSRSPLLAIFGHRDEDGRHWLSLGAEIAPAALRAKGGPEAATREVAAALEAFVRRHPAQWLWLHRRWKGVDQRTAPSETTGKSSPEASDRSASMTETRAS